MATRAPGPHVEINQDYNRLKLLVEGFAVKTPSVEEVRLAKEQLETTQQKIKNLLDKTPMAIMQVALASKGVPALINRCTELLPKESEKGVVVEEKKESATESSVTASERTRSKVELKVKTMRRGDHPIRSRHDTLKGLNERLALRTPPPFLFDAPAKVEAPSISVSTPVITPELTTMEKLVQLAALYSAPSFSQEAFISKFNALPMEDQNCLKGAIWREDGSRSRDPDFGGNSVRNHAGESYVKNAVCNYVNVKAAQEFKGLLSSAADESAVKEAFAKLPGSLQGKIKLGCWLFEGMPKGDSDFGGNFFRAYPKSSTVKSVVDSVIAGEGRLFPAPVRSELTAIKDVLSKETEASKIQSGFSVLSRPVAELIKKSIWVENGKPLDKGVDFSGDLIRSNPTHVSIKTVVNALATHGMN